LQITEKAKNTGFNTLSASKIQIYISQQSS